MEESFVMLRAIRNYLLAKKDVQDVLSFVSDQPKAKNALVSYIKDSLLYSDDDKELNEHTAKWESLEIARIFHRMGYNVDVIDYDNKAFIPQKKYNVIFDIYFNIGRLADKLPEDCTKILHLTGSYLEYSVKQELERVNNLMKRRNCVYKPKRLNDPEPFLNSIKKADFMTLLGNTFTKSTYPQEAQDKIHLVHPTASQVSFIKTKKDYLPNKKTFLWFSGAGAVHKGLDLLLDVFSKRQDIELHVVGPVTNEKDFCDIYKQELYNTENIHFHGFMDTKSEEFTTIIRESFCFIAPSCSEGLSVSSVTCLKMGLYPIMSIQNGIDLPENCGLILKDTNHTTIETAIDHVINLSDAEIISQIDTIQRSLTYMYTRESFSSKMTKMIHFALSANKQ